ncbi:hypothetical protein H7J88_18425 [Mycolicibacterium flavescens]|uniref:Uncharacterized protein n=1 Tax=Mycolicibacterium flavescens TaxID=1776 RepID=A0A1E3RQF4_MYCFV|nr:hypothetical protein [Mycolicibacterium flavescens]MCV7281612.1 hypothetical protein [Mycolicibacterium flavescens]ODQ91642.1 hypothetical protein BHQ18_06140 [Mycolicibacterium flavescens]
MNTLARARNAQKRIFKAQRRLWLLQALAWPTLVLTGVGALAAVVVRYRRADGSTAVPAPVDGLPHL